jgi:hypothetical protein
LQGEAGFQSPELVREKSKKNHHIFLFLVFSM